MSMLDRRIDELIDKEDRHLLRSTQPYALPGLFRLALGSRLGLAARIGILATVLLVAAAVWTAVGLFAADTVMETARYGVGLVVFSLAALQFVAALNTHLHTERVLRALKRVEILLRADHHKQG